MHPVFSTLLRWLLDDWRTLLPAPLANVALALVAVACGAIVGAERERREKPAGLRTLMLVSLGSAIFTLASLAFTTTTGDSGRVAAQIVTGIGFLGAGVIMHGRGLVVGTTTAATIWVTAAIGMTAAAGYAGGALGTSLLVRAVLATVAALELRKFGGASLVVVEIDFEPDRGKTRVRLERVLVDYRVAAASIEWSAPTEQLGCLALHLRLPQLHLRELLAELIDVPLVLSVRESA
jgi:putative Mg2+ transporter-C (MgtC) family protein